MVGQLCPAPQRSHIEQDVPFGFDELFFSRTDERGKIQAGNAVFQRISRYGWHELIGQPHNVIRHDDMPRGVFHLLWDRIRKGLPTGAYVKNRAKDGCYYWVYAIVTPIEAGYLSVRLKPSGFLFERVRTLYADLVHREAEDRLSPAQSAAFLAETLASAGFADYDCFMAASLLGELRERDGKLAREPDPLVGFFSELTKAAEQLLATTKTIAQAYAAYRFVPLNLVVQAGHLGDAGAAIGIISSNYRLLSDEIQSELQNFRGAAERVARTIHEGAFLMSTAGIQQEIASAFGREAAETEIDHQAEMQRLDLQRATYQARAVDNLIAIRRELEDFAQRALAMKRLASGLAAIRVMGKVEAGRLSTGVLSDLIADLAAFQETLSGGLADILGLNDNLRAIAIRLIGLQSAA